MDIFKPYVSVILALLIQWDWFYSALAMMYSGCELNCANGSCNESDQCICYEGFTGFDCSEETDPCESYTCHNGGTCQSDYSGVFCYCRSDWSGEQCEVSVCDYNYCNGHPCTPGTSSVPAYCTCNAGYGGSTCTQNIDDCPNHDCVNGNCVDGVNTFTCNCHNGWEGDKCDVALPGFLSFVKM